MQDLTNKVAVITGGATGIGLALAKALGADGARIVIGEPRAERLAEAATELRGLGISVATQTLDVRDDASFTAFADFAWTTFGQVDLFFNNAGVSQPRRTVAELSSEDLHRVFDVNFFGVWKGCSIFGPRLAEQGTPAAIYNTASENSFFIAVPLMAAYAATKHAVLGLTEAFAEEMPAHVCVGAIFPGFVRSDLIDPSVAGFAMDADEFAQRVLVQIKAGERYIVTHAYNVERMAPRSAAIQAAFAKYAPRYEGDDEYDVRTMIARLTARRSGG